MNIKEKLGNNEILSIYLREHNNRKGPDFYLLKRFLRKKKEKYILSLDSQEIDNIIMPHHFFCDCNHRFNLKGIIWRRFGGLKLREVYSKIDSKYSMNNPTCWGKIQTQLFLVHKKKSNIILCLGRPAYFSSNYFALKNKKDKLYLIDGFHRLIALKLNKNKKLRFILLR
ncbi:MAG: hypothetical protein KJ600_03535 [Nanoarchaeota archaeon]|nr:hypothetical protein [Nanoarchaeota archaeon]MBU1103600.1 hypothetical protein [Nanoarchaeota archaeon]